MAPLASIIVPTRDRAAYLDVALRSIAEQARGIEGEVELLVVDDGGDPAARDVAVRHGARYERHLTPRGLNAARNTGVAATGGPLLVFVDDDVEVCAGWLEALLAAARGCPDHEVFGGPIRARLEGFVLPMCGRESPPVTALDLGGADTDAEFAWGANMAVRRAALERIGAFDESLHLYGDEEEWQRRLHGAGGRVRYVAGARVDHRRAAPDAHVGALCRAAWGRGRNSRRHDVRKGAPPALAAEARTLAGCAWHLVRRRCANGIFMGAHTAGRIAEALRPAPAPGPDFLSGHSGTVGGRRAALLGLADAALDVRALPARRRLLGAAQRAPRRRVLVIGVDRGLPGGTMPAARAELSRSRHDVELAIASGAGERGKFENLNALLADHPAEGHDWLLAVDDDVVLPRGFLDGFVFLAERFDLRLAQPAHRLRSHAAWPVTRRGRAAVRETAFVEIGPVTAFHAETFDRLLPFPPLRMGWGLDVHWGALAGEHGWRMGVVDLLPVAHSLRPAATTYPREQAIAEARDFLDGRPYVGRAEAQRTLAVHRSW